MKITFRRIEPKDFAFLWRLHNVALKNYVTKLWGWDEKRQKQLFEQTFNPPRGQVIVVDGIDAGFLDVVDKRTETLLSSIRLLPEFQNRGVGTRIIESVINKARRENKAVRLQVLKINPARHFYKRLGFEISDETETHFLMRLK